MKKNGFLKKKHSKINQPDFTDFQKNSNNVLVGFKNLYFIDWIGFLLIEIATSLPSLITTNQISKKIKHYGSQHKKKNDLSAKSLSERKSNVLLQRLSAKNSLSR